MQLNGSIHDLRREISEGSDLAPRESRGAKPSGGECEDGVGREISVEQGDKSSVDGGRRGSGKLLIEDALGEGGKVRVSGLGRRKGAFRSISFAMTRSRRATSATAVEKVFTKSGNATHEGLVA